MMFYPKELARDLLYPINKNRVSQLYQMFLEDYSKSYIRKHRFRRYGLIPKFLSDMIDFCNGKIYGNILGLHIKQVNETYFNIETPTMVDTSEGYNKYYYSFPRIPVNPVHHKRKHFNKKSKLMIGCDLSLNTGLPINYILETVVLKRMCIKLGSIKIKRTSILMEFPY